MAKASGMDLTPSHGRMKIVPWPFLRSLLNFAASGVWTGNGVSASVVSDSEGEEAVGVGVGGTVEEEEATSTST